MALMDKMGLAAGSACQVGRINAHHYLNYILRSTQTDQNEPFASPVDPPKISLF
jgi:hypothetical protein